MRNLKILVAIFAITLILSKLGVLAYSTGTYYIDHVKVGGADSSVYTSAARTKVNTGDQTLTGIEQSTSMKTKLQYYNTVTNSWLDGYTNYIVLSTTNFTYPSDGVTSYYPSLMLGDYRVRIAQTSYHLFDGTFTATYNPGN